MRRIAVIYNVDANSKTCGSCKRRHQSFDKVYFCSIFGDILTKINTNYQRLKDCVEAEVTK